MLNCIFEIKALWRLGKILAHMLLSGADFLLKALLFQYSSIAIFRCTSEDLKIAFFWCSIKLSYKSYPSLIYVHSTVDTQ